MLTSKYILNLTLVKGTIRERFSWEGLNYAMEITSLIDMVVRKERCCKGSGKDYQ